MENPSKQSNPKSTDQKIKKNEQMPIYEDRGHFSCDDERAQQQMKEAADLTKKSLEEAFGRENLTKN